jgi:hypothetical protein
MCRAVCHVWLAIRLGAPTPDARDHLHNRRKVAPEPDPIATTGGTIQIITARFTTNCGSTLSRNA